MALVQVSGPLADPESSPDWDQLVREHGPRVYRLALRLTGNRPDAEDLTHDTFVRAFRAWGRYEPGSLDAWLHRIATNLFLDAARRRQRIRFEALPDGPERFAAPAPGPERLTLDRTFEADVQEALAALPADFRAAVVLADIEQLPYEEIAATLGVKVGTVRSRIHRGRKQLRAHLAARARRPALQDEPVRQSA